MTQGRLNSAEQNFREAERLYEEAESPVNVIRTAIWEGWTDLLYRDDASEAVRIVEVALRRFPLSAMVPVDRPYPELVEFFAAAGRVDRARRLLTEYQAQVDERERRGNIFRLAAVGALGLAEERHEDAITALRAWDQEQPVYFRPALYHLGNAYDAAGQADSAVAVWERGVAQRSLLGYVADARGLPHAYRRLGEIYESRGEREKAVNYYNAFVDLWENADPELQPVVDDVRGRIARLVGEQGR